MNIPSAASRNISSSAQDNTMTARDIWSSVSTTHDHKRRAESGQSDGRNERSFSGTDLLVLAEDIIAVIAVTDSTDDIRRCGPAPLEILAKRPREALDLAHTKLHTWPYHQLPRHWRRLYEDASLLLAADMLRRWAANGTSSAAKRSKLSQPHDAGTELEPVVATLDKAIIIAGAPSRRSCIERVLDRIGDLVNIPDQQLARCSLAIVQPTVTLSREQVPRTVASISLHEFQAHLDSSGQPIIIPQAFEHWPAVQRWPDLSYLLRATLNGTRLVPIEIGDNYADESWTQRLVTFADFVRDYLAPQNPTDTGYLAQHDLFEHIPALRRDIGIPDYCYTEPPPPHGAALMTPGLAKTSPLDEPLLNAWLGPKGTKTPLHTDPYHNILCQVVGYKYVRLYPPEETSKLYPRSTDEAGVDMANTTQIDVRYFRPSSVSGASARYIDPEFPQTCPLFADARYREAILAPGESLYIPLGWWHYVESLSTSFSVSFWWN